MDPVLRASIGVGMCLSNYAAAMAVARQMKWVGVALVWLVVLGVMALLVRGVLMPRLADAEAAAAQDEARAEAAAAYDAARSDALTRGWDIGPASVGADAEAVRGSVASVRRVLDGALNPSIWERLDLDGRPEPVQPARIVFPRGSARLTDRSEAALEALSAELAAEPLLFVDLVAEVSTTGDAAANQSLAAERGAAVAAALRVGLNPLRVRIRTEPGEKPIVSLVGLRPGPVW